MKKSQRKAMRNAAQNAAAMREWAAQERTQREKNEPTRTTVLVAASEPFTPEERLERLQKKKENAAIAIERKLQKARLRFAVQEAQAGVCRFVRLKNLRTVSPNRHKTYTYAERLKGLQVENKLYYIKGGMVKLVWINKPGNKVEEVFDGIPKWAPAALVTVYEAAHEAEVRDEE